MHVDLLGPRRLLLLLLLLSGLWALSQAQTTQPQTTETTQTQTTETQPPRVVTSTNIRTSDVYVVPNTISTVSRIAVATRRTTRTCPTPFPTSTCSVTFTLRVASSTRPVVVDLTSVSQRAYSSSVSSILSMSSVTQLGTVRPFYHRNRSIRPTPTGMTTNYGFSCPNRATRLTDPLSLPVLCCACLLLLSS